jgi:2-aminoadipate transaminase
MTQPIGERDLIQLSRGVPPVEAIPTAELCRQTVEVLSEFSGSIFQYAPMGRNPGDVHLREELGQFHGVEPDRLFVGNGSLQVLDLVTAHLARDSHFEVFAEAPTYDRALRIFERRGAKVLGIPIEGDGIDIDYLRRQLKSGAPAFLYTIPDFQNPTGATLSIDKRHALVALAEEHGFPIVEDIPYRGLRYVGSTPPTLGELANPARVITIGSLSKILCPGLRIGYAISDPSTSSDLAALAEDTYLSPPLLCQKVAAKSFAAGLVHANLVRVRDLLRPRHDAAVTVAREILGDALLTVPGGGYFMSARIPTYAEESELLAAARAEGVVLTSGRAFYPNASAEATGHFFLRIPFQSLTPQQLAFGLRKVLEFTERRWACVA